MKLIWPLAMVVLELITATSAVGDDGDKPKVAKPVPPSGATPAWIWSEAKATSGQTVFFRKKFAVKRGRITGAKLYASCDDQMLVFVNGKRVLTANEWQTPAFVDLTDQLKRGQNIIAVRAKNSGGSAGLLMKLDLESSEHDPYGFMTDQTWKVAGKAAEGWQQFGFNDRKWSSATVVGLLGDKPWDTINAKSLAAAAKLREPTATPIERLKVPKDFKVELLYSVPKDEQGSWVNMTVDPQGRLIVSDQYGKLYRVTPPPLGSNPSSITIENIDVDIGEAQGLLWAFDSLYVSVNTGGKYKSGLYRVRDTDGDDRLDTVEMLRELSGRGEHGPHAILLAPDGKSLYIVAGDGTKLTELDSSRVPQVWDEDLILPRIYGRGFMRGVPAPGGCIYSVDPDGKKWQLVSNGFRNQFDAAFNRHGELFTFDADMEWDINTPWYRPTRVCHVVSGAEFGWRNGSGKWPVYFPDSVPPVANVGPGSPTGITFGYGAKFPAKYQEALFICDWSFGKLYVVHLKPRGASYEGEVKEFITGTPLPLTDIVIRPQDGAMYFTIGGRRTKSGLYRVTYTGGESTAPSDGSRNADDALQSAARASRTIRRKLESFHGGKHPQAVKTAWRFLGHEDRFLRYAARVAIEHQDPATWQAAALAEKDPQTALTALLALTRVGDKTLQPRVLGALERLDWAKLNHQQRLDLLRVYGLTFLRMQPPDEQTKNELIARLEPHYPAKSPELNAELCQLLVYLQAPGTAAKTIILLAKAPTQEEQINYAKSLRLLKTGWTMEQRKSYFSWFGRAAGFKGGASFGKFVEYIKNEAVANLSEQDKAELKPILEARIDPATPSAAISKRPIVREWTIGQLVSLAENRLVKRDFDRGRNMFAAAKCFACHRFANEGGAVGPDLTAVSGRFSNRDLLESLVEPDKVISDQYAAVTIVTTSGKVVTGRIVNLAGDSLRVNTDMLDPNAITSVDRKQIDEMFPSKVSMMPKGLLNTLNDEEVLDLMAYLLARGDRNHKMFRQESN